MPSPEHDENPPSSLPSTGSRREFITGMGAVNAMREQLSAVADGDTWQQNDAAADGLWEQYSKPAMACQFEISFNLHQYPQASSSTMLAFQLIDDLEDQLTVYREHSEISQLNLLRTGQRRTVEAGLFSLLQLAQQIHADTEGAFDVTSGQLGKLWGFEARQGSVPNEADIQQTLTVVDSRQLSLDRQDQSVSFLRDGLKINLGGIGKGYAIDRVAELFAEKGIGDFLIHGGQSSVLAYGSSPAATDSGWQVGVSHPTVAGVRLGTISLQGQALGTSGTARQGFFYQGKRYGHIIDPRTGWPSDHWLSTTVVSDSAAVSDALATAFFVMEAESIERFCQQRPEVKALLVQRVGKSSGRVKVLALNFDDTEIDISA